MSRYWLQIQNTHGNWADWLGSGDKEVCKDHGRWLMEDPSNKGLHFSVRVVERVDTQIWSYTPEGK